MSEWRCRQRCGVWSWRARSVLGGGVLGKHELDFEENGHAFAGGHFDAEKTSIVYGQLLLLVLHAERATAKLVVSVIDKCAKVIRLRKHLRLTCDCTHQHTREKGCLDHTMTAADTTGKEGAGDVLAGEGESM